MSASQNILILSSDTGGGHRSAALALENSLRSVPSEKILVEIIRVLEDGSPFTRMFSDTYNYLLRNHQDWMKYYYWFINRFRLNESNFLLRETLKHGHKVVERFAPSAVVSVHPMTQHYASFVLKKLGLLKKIPIITVVTDPCDGFWKGWACDDVDHYIVASEAARNQLIEYGVNGEQISVEGMPVHSRFKPVEFSEKKLLKMSMGLDPERFTVFLNAGAFGGGNIFKMYKSLLAHRSMFNQPFQVVFLAGGNQTLQNQAQKLADTMSDFSTPVKVLGFTPDINHLMNVSDVMVTKLGGLTTFEAIACHLPILGDALTEPMPQEKQTARLIEEGNLGKMLYSEAGFLQILSTLMQHPEKLESMRQACLGFYASEASDRIAQKVLSTIRQ